MCKKYNINSFLYKSINQIFEIYKNYKFKIDNQELFKKSNFILDDTKIRNIIDFINLFEITLKQLSNSEQNILKAAYIDKVHYSNYNCSQSTFFNLKRQACKKFYNLIFNCNQIYDVDQLIYSLKIN